MRGEKEQLEVFLLCSFQTFFFLTMIPSKKCILPCDLRKYILEHTQIHIEFNVNLNWI